MVVVRIGVLDEKNMPHKKSKKLEYDSTPKKCLTLLGFILLIISILFL